MNELAVVLQVDEEAVNVVVDDGLHAVVLIAVMLRGFELADVTDVLTTAAVLLGRARETASFDSVRAGAMGTGVAGLRVVTTGVRLAAVLLDGAIDFG